MMSPATTTVKWTCGQREDRGMFWTTLTRGQQSMRTLTSALTGLLLTVSASVSAQAPQGIVANTVALYTVDYACSSAGCTGHLLACPAGQALVTAKIKYLFMEGVCDDGSATQCNGRMRGLLEDCLLPGRDVNIIGGIMSLRMQGKFRFCFDGTAISDCTGTPPAAEVVGEGVNRMHGKAWLGFPGPIHATDELILETTRPFTIDGKNVHIQSIVTIYDALLQPDLFFNNCGGRGCGLSGTAVLAR